MPNSTNGAQMNRHAARALWTINTFVIAVVFLDSSIPAQQPAQEVSRGVGENWPQFLGPTGDGKSKEEGIRVPWPPGGPRQLWSLPLGPSYGIGSVHRGKYYQFDYIDGQAILHVLDSRTGRDGD